MTSSATPKCEKISARLRQWFIDAGKPNPGQIRRQWQKLIDQEALNDKWPQKNAPSTQTIRLYLNGQYDEACARPGQTELFFSASICVLESMGKKLQPTEVDLKVQRLRAHDEVLRTGRAVLAHLMSAYYGANPPGAIHYGIERYKSSYLTDPDTRTDAELVSVRVNDIPATLIMKSGWIPRNPDHPERPRLVRLEDLDQAKKMVAAPEKIKRKALNPNLASDVAQYLGKTVTDSMTFHVTAIEDGAVPRLTFKESSYHAYYNDCEALSWELAGTYTALDPRLQRAAGEPLAEYSRRLSTDDAIRSVRVFVDNTLRLRRAVHPLDFRARHVGVGVNTLTVLCDRAWKEHLFPLHERGVSRTANHTVMNLAEAAGTLHVIPAGTFQPLTRRGYGQKARDIEFSLSRNVFREFCEELLGKEHLFIDNGLDNDPDAVLEDAEVWKAHRLFSSGRARAYFLGCGLDPVTTKLEVLTLLLIDREAFRAEHLVLRGDNIEGSIEPGPMRPFSREKLREVMTIEHLLAAGAGCVALAYALFEEIESQIDDLLSTK